MLAESIDLVSEQRVLMAVAVKLVIGLVFLQDLDDLLLILHVVP